VGAGRLDNVGQPRHRCRRIYRRLAFLNIPNSGEFAVNPPDRKSLPGDPKPLADADIARLETLLDSLPAPLQPLDVSALDGFLCGVLLQPRRPAPMDWLAHVFDIEARPAPTSPALDELRALVLRRHAELDHAISTRQWFDPWIYQLATEGDGGRDGDGGAPPNECMLPWVAGFAAAMEAYPDLMALTDPELVEPLALVFMHFAPEDLEDADALLAVIDTLEPAGDLAEAVQDLVRALMLMADVTRPQGAAPKSNKSGAAQRSNTPHGPARSFSQNRRR
jgi:uncharacterized protein